MQWFYVQNEQRIGPIDNDDFFRLAREGGLAPTDLVWNPLMGDQWQPASTVPGLLTNASAPSPALPPLSRAGATPNRNLMAQARASLSGKWALGVGVTLLYGILTSGLDLAGGFTPPTWQTKISIFSLVVWAIISGPLMLGWHRVFLQIARREWPNLNRFFDGFRMFWKTVGAYWAVMAIVSLWMLLMLVPALLAGMAIPLLSRAPEWTPAVLSLLIPLFILSLVPAIRAGLGYSQVFFVLSDHPEVRVMESLRRSWNMMIGFKWKYFCLGLRFIGWVLLALLTCGIGLLWVTPYTMTSYAHFYEDIRDG